MLVETIRNRVLESFGAGCVFRSHTGLLRLSALILLSYLAIATATASDAAQRRGLDASDALRTRCAPAPLLTLESASSFIVALWRCLLRTPHSAVAALDDAPPSPESGGMLFTR